MKTLKIIAYKSITVQKSVKELIKTKTDFIFNVFNEKNVN